MYLGEGPAAGEGESFGGGECSNAGGTGELNAASGSLGAEEPFFVVRSRITSTRSKSSTAPVYIDVQSERELGGVSASARTQPF